MTKKSIESLQTIYENSYFSTVQIRKELIQQVIKDFKDTEDRLSQCRRTNMRLVQTMQKLYRKNNIKNKIYSLFRKFGGRG